jgi:hypothetical protein
VFQPNGASLLVGEEFSIQNQSQPPAAFYDEKGDFEFTIPDGAQLSQVSAWGPSGMPVVQGTIDRGPNRYAVAFAFQPGDNGVRISYQIPYGSNSAALSLSSPYGASRMMIAAPPTVQVASDGFDPAPSEQGYSVYTHAGAKVQISVSGTAPPPASDDATASDGGQAAPDQINGRDSGDAASGSLQVVPPRLDSLRWILIAGFAALFALGLVYLLRRPVAAPAIAGDVGGASVAATAPNPPVRAAALLNPRPAAPAPSLAPESVEQAQREVVQSLDGMKDTLFRLELRHQAGTITEEDYARERARLEKVLHDLLRG